MEIIINQKYISGTPRKLRLVVDMIKKMQPVYALEILEFTQKRAADDVSKALRVALANAKQQGMEVQNAFFRKIEVNEGPKMKRFRPGTKGRAKPYKKRMSHIRIILTDDLSNKSQVTNDKLEKKGMDVERKAQTEKSK